MEKSFDLNYFENAYVSRKDAEDYIADLKNNQPYSFLSKNLSIEKNEIVIWGFQIRDFDHCFRSVLAMVIFLLYKFNECSTETSIGKAGILLDYFDAFQTIESSYSQGLSQKWELLLSFVLNYSKSLIDFVFKEP